MRLSPKIEQAIELLESGECETQKAAAARVGVSDTYLCRVLAREQVQVFIAQRRARNIAMGSLRASRRFVQLVGAESEHVAAKVSERLLEQSGDLRTASNGSQVSVNVGVSVGYVIDNSEPAVTIEGDAT